MSTPTFENLVDVYRRSVDIFAERPVFGTKDAGEWHWMTYREFGDQVDRARGGLHRLGIGKGDRVAIISNNRPPWAVAAYASYGLGAVFVPMYEAQVPKEWAYILGDSESRIVFVPDDEIAGQVAGMQGDLPYLDNIVVIDGEGGDHALTFPALLGLGNGEAPEPLGLDEKDLAGFIYTSGTTGNPKGVLLTHGNIVSNVRAMHDVFPLSPDDRSLSFLPWAHSFGQTVELHAGISMGCSMGIARSPQTVVEDLPEVQPTLLVSVPRVFNLIHDGLHKRIAAEGGIRKRIFEAAVANSLRRK